MKLAMVMYGVIEITQDNKRRYRLDLENAKLKLEYTQRSSKMYATEKAHEKAISQAREIVGFIEAHL